MDSKPAYYAIIPANVRYDEKLSSGAKLLYGEITSLCNEKGYCWATNKYFGNLYGKTNRTIENWIKQLIKRGYIISDLSSKKGTQRLISLVINSNVPLKKISSPPEKNFIPNPIYNNKLNKNNSSFKKTTGKYKFGQTVYEMRLKNGEWWCIPPDGSEWLKFAGKESDIIRV